MVARGFQQMTYIDYSYKAQLGRSVKALICSLT